MQGGHLTPQPSRTTALPASFPMVTDGPLMDLPQAKSRRVKVFSFLSAAKAGITSRAARRVRRRMSLSDTRTGRWQVQLSLSKVSLRRKCALRRGIHLPDEVPDQPEGDHRADADGLPQEGLERHQVEANEPAAGFDGDRDEG